ncbi:MAG: PEP-CTERM sorting domain-containing protein [Akkermansia sp.]|nr:PEP-CTERM sorting domain-containing protein [Akkermansia sp.]
MRKSGSSGPPLVRAGNFGIVKSSNVPEPTTGTLSLLALAALAARRH